MGGASALSEVDQLIESLEGMMVDTPKGRFVRVDDLKKYLEERVAKAKAEAEAPKPKTMVQAKRMAMRDETLFPQKVEPREAGRSVPAGPQPPSRA